MNELQDRPDREARIKDSRQMTQTLPAKSKSAGAAWIANILAFVALLISVWARCAVTTVETNLSERQAKGNLSLRFGQFESWLHSFRPTIQDSVSMGLSIAARSGATTAKGYVAQMATDEICRRLKNRIQNRWSDLEIEVRSTLVALGKEGTEISEVSELDFFAKEFSHLTEIKDSALQEIELVRNRALP